MENSEKDYKEAWEIVLRELDSGKYDNWKFIEIKSIDTNAIEGSYFINNDIVQKIVDNPELPYNINYDKDGKAISYKDTKRPKYSVLPPTREERIKSEQLHNLISKNIRKAIPDMPYWILLKRLHLLYKNEKALFLKKIKEKENEIYQEFCVKSIPAEEAGKKGHSRKKRKPKTYIAKVMAAAKSLRIKYPTMSIADMIYRSEIITAIGSDKGFFPGGHKPSDSEYKKHTRLKPGTIRGHIKKALKN